MNALQTYQSICTRSPELLLDNSIEDFEDRKALGRYARKVFDAWRMNFFISHRFSKTPEFKALLSEVKHDPTEATTPATSKGEISSYTTSKAAWVEIATLLGVEQPESLVEDFPPPLQRTTMDYYIMCDVVRKTHEQDRFRASLYLSAEYGFSLEEVLFLLAYAPMRVSQSIESDIEQDRAMMIVRLEDIIARAREVGNLKAEMNAVKEMSQIQGLTQHDQNVGLGEMIKVVENLQFPSRTAIAP